MGTNKFGVKINILLLVFSILLSLLMAEVFFRFYMNRMSDSIQDIGASAWYNSKLKHSPDIMYINAPSNSEYFLSKTLEDDYLLNKDKYIILVLGDSFTHGVGLLNGSNRYSRQLQKKLGDDFFVVNLGWGGANIDDYLTISNLFFEKYHANLTIIGYFPNDIDPDVSIRLPNNEIEILKYPAKKSALFYFIKRSLENKLQLYLNRYIISFKDETTLKKHESYIKKLSSFIKSKNSAVMIISIPFLYQLNDFTNYPMAHQIAFLENVSINNNIYFLDLYPYFKNFKPKKVWANKFDHHPNRLGHEIIANATYDYLISDVIS
ncbi:MAG: SGNH/GDSL hydrolase family protein [Nanoarchaeota archaeon]